MIHSSFKSSSNENVNLTVFGHASFILGINLFEIHSTGVERSVILGRIFWPTAHYVGCWTILTVLFPAPNFIYKYSEAVLKVKRTLLLYSLFKMYFQLHLWFHHRYNFVPFCSLKNNTFNNTFILFSVIVFQCNISQICF